MIKEDDLLVLTVALIQGYGYKDTLNVKGEWIKEAGELIMKRGKGRVRLVLTADPDGDNLYVTSLFGQEQFDEWARLGMGTPGEA